MRLTALNICPGNADLFTDAVSALMGLGYTASEASEAARKAGDAGQRRRNHKKFAEIFNVAA